MGEDFKKRKNNRFVQLRDECSIGGDLFSKCPPETTVNVCGSVVGGNLCGDDELWTPSLGGDGPICFYSGAARAVELIGGAAEHVRQCYASSDSPIVAKVIDISHGLAVLRVIPS